MFLTQGLNPCLLHYRRFLTPESLGKPILWVQDEKIWGTEVLDKMLRSHKLGSGSARIQAVGLQSLSSFLPSVLKAKSSQSNKLSLGSVAVVEMQRWIYQEAEGLNSGPSFAENLPGGPSSYIFVNFAKIYKNLYEKKSYILTTTN